jgi:hypothetical protein
MVRCNDLLFPSDREIRESAMPTNDGFHIYSTQEPFRAARGRWEYYPQVNAQPTPKRRSRNPDQSSGVGERDHRLEAHAEALLPLRMARMWSSMTFLQNCATGRRSASAALSTSCIISGANLMPTMRLAACLVVDFLIILIILI